MLVKLFKHSQRLLGSNQINQMFLYTCKDTKESIRLKIFSKTCFRNILNNEFQCSFLLVNNENRVVGQCCYVKRPNVFTVICTVYHYLSLYTILNTELYSVMRSICISMLKGRFLIFNLFF